MLKFAPLVVIAVYVAWISLFGCPFSKCNISEAAEKKQIKEQKGGSNMKNVTVLTDDNFNQEVLNSEVPVLVDFFATWCGPCRMQMPVIEQFAQEYAGIKVTKADVDMVQNKAREYAIRSVPTLMVFKNGKVVETMLGYHSIDELKEVLKKHM